MIEEWKEYESGNLKYLVSNYGIIKGVSKGNVLKSRLNREGYLSVSLGDAKHKNAYAVHRIVAKLFIENDDPTNKTEIRHIDTNRENARADNLEWITHSEKIKDNMRLGVYRDIKGENNPNYGGKKVKVDLYTKDMEFIKTFEHVKECCEYMIEKSDLKVKVASIQKNIGKLIKDGVVYKDYFIKAKED